MALLAALTLLASARASAAHAPQRAVYCKTPSGDTISVEWTDGNAVASLSDEEKRLVCGDPDPQAANQGDVRFDEAWKRIPFPQARYNLRNFLADRGYFRTELVREGEHAILFRVGDPTVARSLTVVNAPPKLEPHRKRDFLGQRLTPVLLDSMEKWIIQRLAAHGYPCATVTSHANPETGDVTIDVKRGPKQNVVAVEEDPIPGLKAGMLRRYDAFQLGEEFDGDLLLVTENRVNQSGLVQSDHLSARCGPDGAIVRQETAVGPPRMVLLGAGINTEGVLVGKATWRDVRLGEDGSSFDVTAQASTIEQFLSADLNWYTLPFPSRRYLAPRILFIHENQQWYETYTESPWMGWATSVDKPSSGFTVTSGPNVDFIRMIQGYGPGVSHFLSWRTEAAFRTHDYEFWQSSPRTGADIELGSRFNDASVYSTTTAEMLTLSWRALFNYRSFDPPLVVFGLRGNLSTTMTGETLGPGTALPPNFRYYLGGSTDIRGFGLQELPGPNGGLTEAYLGFEARLVATLPIGLEPVAFIDAGALGAEPWRLDRPVYWAPGGGIRWASPIGPIRTTLAHGYIDTVADHWQFFLSLGEEF